MVRCTFALLFLLFATSLPAQSSVQSTIHTARSGNWYVRLTTFTNDTVEGRITALRNDTLRFGRTVVVVSDVAIIDRRIRRGGGALPAGIFGALVLGTIGVGLSGLCEFDCDNAALIGAAGGAAMGMAAGTVVLVVAGPSSALPPRCSGSACSWVVRARRSAPSKRPASFS